MLRAVVSRFLSRLFVRPTYEFMKILERRAEGAHFFGSMAERARFCDL